MIVLQRRQSLGTLVRHHTDFGFRNGHSARSIFMGIKQRRIVGGVFASLFLVSAVAWGQRKAEMSNMELVGYNDLQGRNAYIPTIQKQGDRWIAYVGHHADDPMRMNPLTGK